MTKTQRIRLRLTAEKLIIIIWAVLLIFSCCRAAAAAFLREQHSSSFRRCHCSQQPTNTADTLFRSSLQQSHDNIQQLGGRGSAAIVREGCVLLAPRHEFNHYLKSSALFVYDIFQDSDNIIMIRAVVLDNPTPFVLSEMIDSDTGPLLSSHLLFRGGGSGDSNIVWFHNVQELDSKEEVGENSGVYRGTSLSRAVEYLSNNDNQQTMFKFFFHYVEFRQQELEELLEDVRDNDVWVSLSLPPRMILDNSYDKNDCWARLRNFITQQEQQQK